MAHYLVREAHGPTWDPDRRRRDQEGFAAHAAFLDGLVEAGTILLGGPLGEDVDAGDALLLVASEDEAGARAALSPDPWLGTILTISGIERWWLWLGASAASA